MSGVSKTDKNKQTKGNPTPFSTKMARFLASTSNPAFFICSTVETKVKIDVKKESACLRELGVRGCGGSSRCTYGVVHDVVL